MKTTLIIIATYIILAGIIMYQSWLLRKKETTVNNIGKSKQVARRNKNSNIEGRIAPELTTNELERKPKERRKLFGFLKSRKKL